MKMFSIKTSTVIFLFLLSACTRMVVVDINAIVDPELAQTSPKQLQYILSPAKNTAANDLYFKEFSAYFERILKTEGYTRSLDKNSADIEIVFSYGLSDGPKGVYTYYSPIYEYTSGETITVTETNADPNVQSKVTTIHVPSRYERVGTSLESKEYASFIGYAALEAKSLSAKPNDSEKPSLLWRIELQSKVGNDDLRKIMPYLAHAAGPYIGKNSGHELSVSIKENDPSVRKANAVPR